MQWVTAPSLRGHHHWIPQWRVWRARVMEEADYLDPFQSGFMFGHSNEIVLISQVDDLWQAQDYAGSP